MKRTLVYLSLVLWGARLGAVDVNPMVERGERGYREGRWVEARDTLLRAAALTEDAELKASLFERVGEINLELLLSPYEQPEAVWLEVQPGDTLGKVAGRANSTIELVKAMNRLTNNTLRLGRRIKVPYESFSVVVGKRENSATVYLGGRFFKRYAVSTGAGDNTPVGEFLITDRIVHPDWWHPETRQRIPYGHPDHRIGTHWLGWDRKGFGIHGTDEPEKIGQSVSLGCVRMHNEDVEELYMLLPSGTTVTVEE
ncbi:MAG: L,D-transpeptidase family protein [Kiritimatiellae bacterium]|jgi:lipoprotein-anchoring transpeptidase ErfK/SrfK|nr:L,D-transpeptidase family protein [Kiritimatiellia bacterium]